MTTSFDKPAPAARAEGHPATGTLPFRAVLGLLVGCMLYLLTRPALLDVDLYWHVLAGRELIDGVGPGQVGATWSFAPDPAAWVSTQWLSEVLLAGLYSLGGWSAFVVMRTLTAAIAMAVLSRTTLRGRPTALAAFPFLIASAAVMSVSQERPQQATLVGAALLGGVLVRGLDAGRLPRWWLVLPLTILWANLHGGWVLVPVALGLIAAGRLLDHGPTDRVMPRALVLALGAVLAGSLTPSGPSGTWAVMRFAGATDTIIEWQPTTPTADVGYLTLAMLLVIGIAWSRPTRIPRSEVLATASLTIFGWIAWRYVAPALLLIAPLVAHQLTRAFPGVGRTPEPRWSTSLGVGLATVLMLAGLATVPGRDHLPRGEFPVELAARIAELPAGQRVLNDYNTAGLVLFFGGESTRVGIDGRADRYGQDYITAYARLDDLGGSWSTLLTDLNPTSALIKTESPLAHVLTTERGWEVVGTEGDWALLTAPQKAA